MERHLISLQDIKKLRKSAVDMGCIYFLFQGDELVYIGSSVGGGVSRVRSHIPFKQFDSYAILDCKSSERRELEARYIFSYRPRLQNHWKLPSAKAALELLGPIENRPNREELYKKRKTL